MRIAFVAAASIVLASLVGCAAGTTEETGAEGNDAYTASASTACTPAQYNEGLAHYKKAVASSKVRAKGMTCEGENGDDGTVYGITSASAAAVKACGAFKDVIAKSVYAEPIRTALKDNLALPYLTGGLDPAKGNAGLEAALVGKTVWGPAPGVYGNMSKVTFQAGGKATVSVLDIDTNETSPTWRDAASTWSVKTVNGKSAVVLGESTYAVELDKETSYGVNFNLTDTADGDKLTSLPSECEA